MVKAVTGWLGKLNFNKLKSDIAAVKGWFYDMYDKVVGRSYVPDMVDGIVKHIARLEAEMVSPVQKTTGKVSKAAKEMAEKAKASFEELQEASSQMSAILSRLFPEEARAAQYADELAFVQKWAEKLGLTAEETAAAIAKLNAEFQKGVDGDVVERTYKAANDRYEEAEGKAQDVMDRLNPGRERHREYEEDVKAINDMRQFGWPDEEVNEELTKLRMEYDEWIKEQGTGADKTREHTLAMVEAFADMAAGVAGSLGDLVSAIKKGDWIAALQSVLDIITQLAPLFSKGGIFGPSASPGGGDVTSAPGYSTGGSFKVGGSGGVDSQLIRLRATPGEQIDVRRGDQMRQQPLVVYVKKGEMFDAEVHRVASPMVEEGVIRGAVGGASIAARNAQRTRRSALR